MVLIAYNHNGIVLSILNAKSEDIAKAYLHGAGIMYDTLKNLDDEETFTSLSDHPTGVYAILKTVEIKASIQGGREQSIICVKQ